MCEDDFQIQNNMGDAVSVSLKILPNGHTGNDWLNQVTIYNINLARVSGTHNISIAMLARIADEIAIRVDNDPCVALFYVCDYEHPIPSQRKSRTGRLAEYRDSLFGAMFRRVKDRLGLDWRDHTVYVGRQDDPNRTSAHIIIHETKFNAARAIEQIIREYTADK